MRRATLTALTLLAGVALAQNPFRDLMPAPAPEPAASAPITIDIPASPLPAPPASVHGFPALPAPGAYETGAASSATPPAPVVNVPDQPVVFPLPDLPTAPQADALHVTLRNPLHADSSPRPAPLLEPLPAPTTEADHPTAQPETAGEKASPWCVDGAVLATSSGHAPTALIRCGGVTHLLRVGDTIPGTDATVQDIHSLGVTITREGADHQLHLAAN